MAKYYGKKQSQPGQKGNASWALLAMVGALALIIVGVIVLVRPGQALSSEPGGAQVAQGARVAVDREKLDFGQVKMDTPITAAFKVKNVGSEPLQIQGEPQVRVVEGC